MPSLADLVSPDRLAELATPANRRLGTQIRDEDGVTIEEFGPLRVTATVGGVPSSETRRHTMLASSRDQLDWSCTCTKRDLFCKHCVALALVTWDKSPPRR
jgi:hypothetical protein